jgi:hypothetical protein
MAFATANDVTYTAVWRWEAGINTPPTGKLPQIAEMLGIEIGDLFDAVDDVGEQQLVDEEVA